MHGRCQGGAYAYFSAGGVSEECERGLSAVPGRVAAGALCLECDRERACDECVYVFLCVRARAVLPYTLCDKMHACMHAIGVGYAAGILQHGDGNAGFKSCSDGNGRG